MEIKEINNKEKWENFLAGCEEKTFLQSWNWGDFWQRMGNLPGPAYWPSRPHSGKIWRLGIYDNGDLIAVCLVILIKARRGTYLLLPHGPMIIQNYNSKLKINILTVLLAELKKIGKQEKADFIRIAPLLGKSEENEKIFRDLGFREAPMHANAYQATIRLDIQSSEEELLKNMRKTTRYLIKKALANKEISTEKGVGAKDLEAFLKISKETSKRQKFIPFSDVYIKNEFEIFAKDNQAIFLFGKYKGEIAAGALIIFWSKIGFYHQAASLGKFAKLSIPYLLQWEAIKEAKRRGCLLYDFWGYVDPKKEPNHPWAGPTLFKMGFGGKIFQYLKTQDLPLSKKYYLTYLFEKIRKIKRRL